MAIKVYGLSKKKIERFACKIRGLFNLEDPDLKCNILRILEIDLPKIDPSFSIEIRDKDKMDDCMALYKVNSNKIVIENSVYDGAISGNGRDVFTLAHELGHYFLHPHEVILARYESNENIKPYEDPEWQASTFASYFLLPRINLPKFNSIEDIALHYGTSKQAAKIAYKDVKKPN